jgi:predicted nucleic acid-binding protein
MRFGANAKFKESNPMFVDTSYLVGLADRKDQRHEDARRIAKRVRKHPRLTNLVVVEAFTIVRNRSGGKPARTLYDYFVDECDVIFVNRALLDSAIVQHARFDGALSLADCATVAAMTAASETDLVSVDSDFDRVAGLSRLY